MNGKKIKIMTKQFLLCSLKKVVSPLGRDVARSELLNPLTFFKKIPNFKISYCQNLLNSRLLFG